MSCSEKSAELSLFDFVKLSGKVAHIYLSDGDIGEGAGDEVEVEVEVGPACIWSRQIGCVIWIESSLHV